jgi:hypothetical protein
MTARFGKAQKAAALVPLAALSAAWTISVTGLGASSAEATGTNPPALPDGTVIPAKAITAPATVIDPGTGSDLSGGKGQQMVASATSAGIPAAALAAYQRAASVIDKADPGCHLDWQLLGAIGRVESDHGRTGGNTLDDHGIATPGIFGPVLDGSHHTSAIADTDGGQFDGDTTYDRAVGPMQFIPSTWSIVGVDADGDGKRDPQDINDAALAAAVYLCSGTEDLATTSGQRAAVFRYNHSQQYVDTVLAIADAYRAGDFTSVPNFTVPAPYLTPSAPSGPKKAAHAHHAKGSHHGDTTPAAPAATPTRTSQPQAPTGAKSAPSKPSAPKPSVPTSLPTSLPSTGVAPVDKGLTQAQALTKCLSGPLGTTVKTLVPNVSSLSLSSIVATLKTLPLLGGPAAATQLQSCVTDAMKG